jgi:DNA repair protein RadC
MARPGAPPNRRSEHETFTDPAPTPMNWPTNDRARERLRTLGPRALSPRELLGILLEGGTPAADETAARSSLDLAGDLLGWFAPDGSPAQALRRLMTAPFGAVSEVPGIGPAKAARIQAALELGRLAVEEGVPEMDRLNTASEVYVRMRARMRNLPHEEFHVLLLNLNCEVLRDLVIGNGYLTTDGISPRDVYRAALAENAHSMVLAHNHPHGESNPTAEDIALTRAVDQGSRLIGIELLDHVIIGPTGYYSFAESTDLLPSAWMRSAGGDG